MPPKTLELDVRLAERAAALRAEIEQHNTAYYVLDAPQIPDVEYDTLYAEFVAIETLSPCSKISFDAKVSPSSSRQTEYRFYETHGQSLDSYTSTNSALHTVSYTAPQGSLIGKAEVAAEYGAANN